MPSSGHDSRKSQKRGGASWVAMAVDWDPDAFGSLRHSVINKRLIYPVQGPVIGGQPPIRHVTLSSRLQLFIGSVVVATVSFFSSYQCFKGRLPAS